MKTITNIAYSAFTFGVLASMSKLAYSEHIMFISIISLIILNGINTIFTLINKLYKEALLYTGAALFFATLLYAHWDNETYLLLGTGAVTTITLYHLFFFKTNAKHNISALIIIGLSAYILYYAYNSSSENNTIFIIASILTLIFTLSIVIVKYFSIRPIFDKIKDINYTGANIFSLFCLLISLNVLGVLPNLYSSNAIPSRKEVKAMNKENRDSFKTQLDSTNLITNQILEQ